MKKIYLDYSAATPIDLEVKKTIDEVSKFFANPAANYSLGKEAGEILNQARKNIGMSLNAKSDEIIFTSGTTESNNLAIFGLARANKKKGNHLITIETEHPSVLVCFKKLKKEGFRVSFCKLKSDGSVDLGELAKLITKRTILVSISLANSEIGVVQPITKIAKILKNFNHKVFLHTDASAAANFIKLNVDRLGVDALSIGGSKIYGPISGALYVRRGIGIEPIIFGGEQNFGVRAGTQDISLAFGLSKALVLSQGDYKKQSSRMSKLRSYFLKRIKEIYPDVIINNNQKGSLPNLVNISFDGLDGEDLMYRFDKEDIIVGTGAACKASDDRPNRSLLAIGRTKSQAQGSLRISLGRNSSKHDIDKFFIVLKKILNDLDKIR